MIDSTRKTYFSPDDDTTAEYLNWLNTAKKKVRIADYSFNMDAVVELLIRMHQAGLDVSLVLDKSQSAGSTERPEITKLREAGVPFVVGTSEKHAIMHEKFTVLDDEWVQSGSWNYTNKASDEDNFFDIEHSPQRAVVFTAQWQRMHDWILANEAQPVV